MFSSREKPRSDHGWLRAKGSDVIRAEPIWEAIINFNLELKKQFLFNSDTKFLCKTKFFLLPLFSSPT